MSDEHRRTAAWTTLVGAVLLVGFALWRVPWDPVGGTPLPAVAPRDFFTAVQVRRGQDYASWVRVWSLSSLVVSLVVACGLGLTARGRRLVERVVGRLGGPWWWRSIACVVLLSVVGRVLTLPFAVLVRRRVRAYGLSDQSWSGFASDLVRTEVVTVVATSIGVVVFLAVARRWRRRWPAIAGAALGVLVMLGSFVYPLVVEPLFNTFTPLPAGSLRTRILALADVEGVHVDDVLVADASRRTTTLNAYVSGYGGTRRVVLYDNLVDDLPQDETLSVVAHELGHARRDDVLTGSVLGALGVVTGIGLLGLVLGRRRPGPGGPGGPAGERAGAGDVPRLLALVALATVLVTPVQDAVSRRIETRADVAALAATHDPEGFVGLQRQLAIRSVADLTTPAVWQWWFGTHPTTMKRIALALRVQDEGGS